MVLQKNFEKIMDSLHELVVNQLVDGFSLKSGQILHRQSGHLKYLARFLERSNTKHKIYNNIQ